MLYLILILIISCSGKIDSVDQFGRKYDTLTCEDEDDEYASSYESIADREIYFLHNAAIRNRVERVIQLVDRGVKVDIKDGSGSTALHWAAINGNAAVTATLLGKGANINEQQNYGYTALHWAAYYGYPKVAIVLLADPKIDKSIRNKLGETALDIAEQECKKDFDLTTSNGRNYSAIETAKQKGREDIVALLRGR